MNNNRTEDTIENSEEILKYLVKSGKINLNDAEEDMKKSQMDQILDQHPYSIYQGSNGKWYTTVTDVTKPDKRRKIVRTSLEELKVAIYEFYTGVSEHKKLDAITIEKLYPK